MRTLVAALDEIAQGYRTDRQPAWRIEVYDLRSTTDTFNDIVRDLPLLPDTGPLEFTDLVQAVDVEEMGGDYAGGGISASALSITILDPTGVFDPDQLRTDLTVDARFFRKRNVVRLYEGDARIPPSEWPATFTGRIAAQPGYSRSAATGRSKMTIRCLSRHADFMGFTRTSAPFAQGTTYLNMAVSVAENEMGLDSSEIDFASFGSKTLAHRTVQLVEEDPLSMLARIMFIDGLLPTFDGYGKLTQQRAILPSGSDRYYPDPRVYQSIDRASPEDRGIDSVRVVGLDSDLTPVRQPLQLIAETNVTTGFFTSDELIPIYFSEDQTVMAENVLFSVVKSVNGGLSFLGGGEAFALIPTPGVDAEGSIGIYVSIDTGFAPWLAVFLTATYIALAFVPDEVALVFTIPTGRIAQAIALSSALLIMTKIGRGQYEVYGEPFEYVYAQIRRTARSSDVGEFTANEIEIENHLVDDEALAQQLARDALFFELAKGHPRDITMLHDVALEPLDAFSDLVTDRRFVAMSIRRRLIPEGRAVFASIRALEISDNTEQST